ncbi:phospholipid carrier-dependent glycosyltransferase [Clostridiaceae bacterium OttesenSCG-928-D20]|nr:phospholipid carrier-dependent glycosyltransferase [Clostridiaceae bacterium OttesenSCG-928-D20]
MFVILFPIALIGFILYSCYRFWRDTGAFSPVDGAEGLVRPVRLSFEGKRHKMERLDLILLALITVLYSFAAFYKLGDKDATESSLIFEGENRHAQVEFKESINLLQIQYFSILHTGEFKVTVSSDGVEYTEIGVLEQGYNHILKWNDLFLDVPADNVRFLRIISSARMEIGELVFYDIYNQQIPADMLIYDDAVSPLFDEQDKAKNPSSYMDSAYFDEIYHPRTALEHIRYERPYETSHPPLGKIFIGIGVRLFGMNPFGWRFIGTLMGILMLPLLYVFLKNLFGSTALSVCGTLLLSSDFMHLVQTRIATIDSYAVFFIMGMYFFMYRYVTSPREDGLEVPKGRLFNLFMSGIFFGVGAASKWTVIYGVLGLALIWFIHWFSRGRDLIACGRKEQFRDEIYTEVFLSVFAFIIIPVCIYYASYYPYGKANGLSGASMFIDKEYFEIFWKNQKFMLTYHVGIESTHPYSSSWYQWIFNIRPILYYLRYPTSESRAIILAFLNPLISWMGLVAMVNMGVLAFKRSDRKALFILIGYLSQLLPWLLVPRLTFAYHYFPCVIFLILAIVHCFDIYRKRCYNWRKAVYAITALSVLLFLLYFPTLTGQEIPKWYARNILQWLPSWPI